MAIIAFACYACSEAASLGGESIALAYRMSAQVMNVRTFKQHFSLRIRNFNQLRMGLVKLLPKSEIKLLGTPLIRIA